MSHATTVSLHPSTNNYVHFNLFCDCSRSKTSDEGRCLQPLIITAAWPVNPMYDTGLGEFFALCECLLVAMQQIRQFAQ
jgi:hypothetical protein